MRADQLAATGLNERHLVDLRRSGLNDETIAAAGLHSLSAAEVRGITGVDGGPGLAIPYPGAVFRDGSPYVRVRLDSPRPMSDGSSARYLTRRGERNHLYLPPNLPSSALSDPTVALTITEGEKKALKACQEGIPCVGLAGVWCWKTKIDGESVALPGLDSIVWRGRQAVIAFDSDSQTNRSVRAAQDALAEELAGREAQVRIPKLPAGPNGEKVGLDDYLLAHTKKEFRALVAGVPEWRPRSERNPGTSPLTKSKVVGGEVSDPRDGFSFLALRQSAHEEGFRLHYLAFLGGLEVHLFCRDFATLLAAYPKSGKTTLLFALTRHWATEGHDILYITEEAELVWKARVLAAPEEGLERMVGLAGLGVDPAALLQRAAGGHEDTIVVDTTNLLGIEDGNDAATVRIALTPWVQMGREKGKTTIFATHTNKSLVGDLKAVAGSYNFAAVVDTVLVLSPHESPNRRVLGGASRVFPVEPVMYELRGGQLRCLGDPKDVTLEAAVSECIRVLRISPGDRKKTREVLDAMNDPKPSLTQVQEALSMLADRGSVLRDPPVTQGKQPGATYRWSVPAPETSPPTTPVLVGGEVGGSAGGAGPAARGPAGEEEVDD